MSRERHSLRKLMYTLDKVGTLKKPRMGLKEWVMCSAGKWCSRGMKLVAEEYMAKQGRASAALLLYDQYGTYPSGDRSPVGLEAGKNPPTTCPVSEVPVPRCTILLATSCHL